MTAVARRRTQEERSAATKARLLDATLECLAELGYARTTTTEIAERGGVSRGAQLHHFPTKAELVTEAVAYLFDRRDEEFRAAFAKLPADADRGAAAVDILWSMVSGPTFHAWLELAVAARTDPLLKPKVAFLTTRFTANVTRTFQELFPRPDAPAPYWGLAPAFTFALLEGLALDLMVTPDSNEIHRVLDIWRGVARLVMSGAPLGIDHAIQPRNTR
ncbi:MAG TPA: TetR/AcrR family transcriptional regulator [Polyangiaceae bacterium]|jgi:AcrR family transcriptional regulator|nr:TetR/AcrR family transcriptional regulator [Polyangiaceae bacterium]